MASNSMRSSLLCWERVIRRMREGMSFLLFRLQSLMLLSIGLAGLIVERGGSIRVIFGGSHSRC